MKCSFCNQESIYFRKNEGYYYCKDHFTKSIEKRARKIIRENNLIDKKDKIAVALSGGKDSSTTLYLLKKIFKNNPNIEIIGITIDQGFGCVTEYDATFASQLCKKLGQGNRGQALLDRKKAGRSATGYYPGADSNQQASNNYDRSTG